MSKIKDDKVREILTALEEGWIVSSETRNIQVRQCLTDLLASREELKQERLGNGVLSNENNKLSIELSASREREMELEEFVKDIHNTSFEWNIYAKVGVIKKKAKALTPTDKEEVKASVVCTNHIGPNEAGNCYVCGEPYKAPKENHE